MVTGNHIETIAELFDQSIEYTDSIDCHLSLYLSHQRLTFSIYSKKTNLFIGLGDYRSPKGNYHHLTEILDQFSGGFGSVSIALETKKATFVPEALLVAENLEDYYRNTVSPDMEKMRTDKLFDGEIALLYDSDPTLHHDLKKHFPNAVIHHWYFYLIDYFVGLYKNDQGAKLIVEKSGNSMNILALQKGELLLCNQFDITTAEDFVYFIMFAIDQFKFSAGEFQLVLLGKRNHYLKEVALLDRYIRNMVYFEQPKHHKYSPEFSKLVAQSYHNLYIQFACVS